MGRCWPKTKQEDFDTIAMSWDLCLMPDDSDSLKGVFKAIRLKK